VLALLTLVALVFVALRRGRGLGGRADVTAPVLLAAWFVSLSLLLLDALPLGYFKIGAWTALNSRYAMQWYVSAGLLAAWGCAATFMSAHRRFPRYSALLSALAGGFLVISTLLTARALERGWPVYETNVYRSFAERLNSLTAPLPVRCRILAEDTGVNFHAMRTVVQMYSRHQLPLMREETPHGVIERLDADELCAVVIYNGLYIDMAGPDTPLSRALASEAFRLHNSPPWRIYIREPLTP
jgi:hypothetical protein